MLFIDVNLENWCTRFPELEVVKNTCAKCGEKLIADQPFIMKGFAGLTSMKCSCVDHKSYCMSRVTTSSEEFIKWAAVTLPHL